MGGRQFRRHLYASRAGRDSRPMRKLISLRRSNRGAAAIEMAIALPVLVLFVYGIFEIGVAGQAIAGMQHGLGEGARYATICMNPTSGGVCGVPTNDQIKQ